MNGAIIRRTPVLLGVLLTACGVLSERVVALEKKPEETAPYVTQPD